MLTDHFTSAAKSEALHSSVFLYHDLNMTHQKQLIFKFVSEGDCIHIHILVNLSIEAHRNMYQRCLSDISHSDRFVIEIDPEEFMTNFRFNFF